MILDGDLREDAESRTFHAAAGDFVVKPAGTEHANRVGPFGATTLQIELPTADWRRLTGNEEKTSYCWQPAPLAARDYFRLAQRIFAVGHAKSAERNEIELSTLIRNTLAQATPSAPRPDWLTAAENAIERQHAHSISVRDIAIVVDVHPVHLARTFRRVHGCSVIEYLHRVRIQAATRLLRDPQQSLADIAQRVGCCDQSHLCRLFANRIGISPAAYRALQHN